VVGCQRIAVSSKSARCRRRRRWCGGSGPRSADSASGAIPRMLSWRRARPSVTPSRCRVRIGPCPVGRPSRRGCRDRCRPRRWRQFRQARVHAGVDLPMTIPWRVRRGHRAGTCHVSNHTLVVGRAGCRGGRRRGDANSSRDRDADCEALTAWPTDLAGRGGETVRPQPHRLDGDRAAGCSRPTTGMCRSRRLSLMSISPSDDVRSVATRPCLPVVRRLSEPVRRLGSARHSTCGLPCRRGTRRAPRSPPVDRLAAAAVTWASPACCRCANRTARDDESAPGWASGT